MIKCAVVWDLGASNQTVALVDAMGLVIDSRSLPTESMETSEGIIWPFETLFERFCSLTLSLSDSLKLNPPQVLGVSTFGVCWAPIASDGQLSYPVISWKCSRTHAILAEKEIQELTGWLYQRSGAPPMYFNTLYTLLWMRRHHPEALDKASDFLMMPQLFVHRLTGAKVVDRGMATTSMLVNLKEGAWDSEIFARLDLPNKFPQKFSDCEEIVGTVNQSTADLCGLPSGLPVIAGGHDTVIGTASLGKSMLDRAYLSTGTWNLLLSGKESFSPHPEGYKHSLAWQFNPGSSGTLGGYNNQALMIGGLALEYVKQNFAASQSFSQLEKKLENFVPGAGGLRYIPNLVAGTGPFPKAPGALVGIKEKVLPETYFQAALEGLAFMVQYSSDLMGLRLDELIIGGGLSKSPTFCKILAAMLRCPVLVAKTSETTALGVAALSFAAQENVSIDMIWKRFSPSYTSISNDVLLTEKFAPLIDNYSSLAEALS